GRGAPKRPASTARIRQRFENGLLLPAPRANGWRMDGEIGGQTVRVALRDATGPVHERIHRARPFAALARGDLALGDYRKLLAKLGAYYFGASSHLPIDGKRLSLLRDDLDALDAAPPCPAPMARPRSEPARLGWRYVVDGSIFGGRVIHRQLDYLFGNAERG